MNKRLKVLFTTNIPVPYRIDFYNELGKYVDLTVTFERHNAKSRDATWLGKEMTNFKGIFLKGIPIGDDIAFCPGIIKIVKDGYFDKILVGVYYSPTGILLTQYLRLTNTSYFMTGDGGFAKKDNFVKHAIKKYLNGGAKCYLITSEASMNALASYDIPRNIMRKYLFSSLKANDLLKQVAPSEEKARLRTLLGMQERKIILCVGRLFLQKGWQDMIGISDKLGADCGVYLVGGNPKGTEFESFIGKTPKNFHFVDFKQKNDLENYYKAADVFVLPSRHDVWGLVVNEAMAMGLPVISTYTTVAALELVKDGENGFLYNAGNTNTLLTLLQRLLGDDVLRHDMGEKSLIKIRPYTIENMAKTTYDIIESFKA